MKFARDAICLSSMQLVMGLIVTMQVLRSDVLLNINDQLRQKVQTSRR